MQVMVVAKNRNTFEKHRREVEKKRKAEEKRQRRIRKKEDAASSIGLDDAKTDSSDEEDAQSD